ncbi:unnamed protein product [Rotaria sordida]|uniref:Helicase ATP-binding domain-containing protein n=1 Tax=Rotaria sordida TaxID=392033 RepID=A0A813WXF4_9BILA|nr:unnamed protein product [Rotaria sordida]CAF0857247.1 unnamed protein product [Rotaria sordida]
MKLLTDGELFYRIRTQTSFSEKEAGQLMKKLILTVNFMHNNDLCHRDFKPENLLFASSDSNAEIKIIDFDFAKQNVRAVNVTMRAFQKADQFQLSSVTNGVLTRRRYNKKSTDSCLFTSSLKITRPAQQKFGQQDSKSECDSYECFRSKTANGFLRSSSLKQLSCVFDIEQFTEYCPTTYAVCSCYTSRVLINDVQIILYSYHYFIDPRVRNSMQISINKSIIIIDEAHYIEHYVQEIRANQKALEMAQIKVDQLLTNGSDFSLIQDSLSSTQQQSARRTNCLIFASGTLAPLATYFDELTISFDTQMNLLLEYNHVIDIQRTFIITLSRGQNPNIKF